MKRTISTLIVLLLILGNFVCVFATDQGSQSNDTKVDVLVEKFTRGVDPPTQFKNLATGSYYFTGTYKVMLYTNYYFSPNSSGNIKVNATTTWPANYTMQKQMIVTLINKNTGVQVGTVTGKTVYNPSTQMYGKVASISNTFSGLDTNSFYYFRIEKTNDTIDANLSGSVSW